VDRKRDREDLLVTLKVSHREGVVRVFVRPAGSD
jgi:hypothetical protein